MSSEKQAMDFEFEVLTTADGSPSLRLWKDHQAPEAMHNSAGALSETMYIYDAAILKSLELSKRLSILSVGLGLGYNEILAAARAYEAGLPLHMQSFESEATLRQAFTNWLHDHHSPEPFKSTYEKILSLIAHQVGVLPQQIKTVLVDAEVEGRWELRGSLDISTEFRQPFHCVLFDAFSKGATPDLWTEDFLFHFIEKACAKPCVFSTYAATGSLRRSLTAAGFEVDLRPGFSGKRQSTFAIRA